MIIIANPDAHSDEVRELFWEYLQWANARVEEEFGVRFDIAALLEGDMQHLDKFMPPGGRLLLAYDDERLAGIACLKPLAPGIGEIKRMYIRPASRRRGLGRALLQRLLEEAPQIGYERVRLDSAAFMHEAHQLYRAMGFREIDAYEGSEIPVEFQHHWYFMERSVPAPNPSPRIEPYRSSGT
jgi:GNAT superfamily N-acetyltransferase